MGCRTANFFLLGGGDGGREQEMDVESSVPDGFRVRRAEEGEDLYWDFMRLGWRGGLARP